MRWVQYVVVGETTMVESARAVCVAWKEVLRGRDEDSKEKCMEAYKEEKKKIKSCMCQSKKEVNE